MIKIQIYDNRNRLKETKIIQEGKITVDWNGRKMSFFNSKKIQGETVSKG